MPQPHKPVLRIADFQERVRKGERPDGMLRKGFACDITKAEGEGSDRTLRIRITTASRDRDNDTIAPNGWRLANYLKNPVVLYCHDYYGLPIAQDKGLTADALGLIGTPQFTTREQNPLGDTVFLLMQGGFLRAASIGMDPIKYAFNEEERGIDFIEQELLEYSIVPVPANPEALQEAKAAGIDVAPLVGWAEEILDRWTEEKGIWMPRKSLERALKVLDGNSLVLPLSAELKAKLGATPITTVDELLAAVKSTETAPPAPTHAAPPAPAPVPVPPAETPSTTGADDVVLELADEPEDETIEVSDEDLESAIGERVASLVADKFTALTGCLP